MIRPDDPYIVEYVRGLIHGILIAFGAYAIGLLMDWVTR